MKHGSTIHERVKTPEAIQTEDRTRRAAEFADRMLGIVQKRLFHGRAEKEWWHGQRFIKQAILEPSRWMQERAAALSPSRYRDILIEELIAANTWPDKWTGNEQKADLPYEKVFRDGSVQPFFEGILQ